MNIHKFIRRHDFISGKPFSSLSMIEVVPRIIFDFVPNRIPTRYSTTMIDSRYYSTITYNNPMPMINGTVIF